MNRKDNGLTVKAIKPFLEVWEKEGWSDENSSFALVCKEGIWLNAHMACYASLGGDLYKGEKRDEGFLEKKGTPIGLILAYQKDYYPVERQANKIVKADSLKYLDWLLNRSPWAKAFVSKHAAHWFEKGVVLIDPKVAGNLLGGACVGYRRLWESTFKLRAWNDLTSKGVPEHLAYYLVSCLFGDTDYGVFLAGDRGGHHNLDTVSMGQESLKAFIKGEAKLSKPYPEKFKYDGYSNMFLLGDSKGTVINWLKGAFPQVPLTEKKEEVTREAYINPFAAAKVKHQYDEQRIPYSVFIDNMAVWWPNIYKEIGLDA